MNVFALEEEQAATVEEVLAFLDACDGDEVANAEYDHAGTGSDSTIDSSEHALCSQFLTLASSSRLDESGLFYRNRSSSIGSSSDCSIRFDELDTAARPERQLQHYWKTREANVAAVSKYRHRKRHEILELRKLVKQLTARVAHLRKRKEVAPERVSENGSKSGGVSTIISSRHQVRTPPPEHNPAVSESLKLRESKVLNRKLKEALAKQGALTKTLESLVEWQIAQHVRTRLHCGVKVRTFLCILIDYGYHPDRPPLHTHTHLDTHTFSRSIHHSHV